MLYETQSSLEHPAVYPSLSSCGAEHIRSKLKTADLDPPPPGMTDEADHVSIYNVADSVRHNLPAHPTFSLFADRIKTFTTWPRDLHQKPNDLAVAGFFYQGTADIVTCYSCGGSLKEWEPSDVPIVEHAHWFPSCAFLLQTKGENFIREAQLQSQEASKEDCNVADSVFANGVESRTQSPPVQNSKYTETMDQILNTPAALSVLSMGYSRDMVCQAIERCLQSGKLNLPAVEIMKVIIEMEEEEENLGTEKVPSETIGETEKRPSETKRETNDTKRETSETKRETSEPKRETSETKRETSETKRETSETKCEDVWGKECEKGHDRRETEIDFVKHHQSDSKMYSQCTEEPLSGQNTMYTSVGPATVYASSEPIPTYPSTGPTCNTPVLDKFGSLSLQKELSPQKASSPELLQVDDLAEENRKLKESNLCKVCLDKNSDTVFLPCGHLATCAVCASSLRKCPLCRQFIRGTVKVYLA